MQYEDYFTNYEKRLNEAMLNGFLNNNFQPLYEYMYKTLGQVKANQWMMKSKRDKKLTCAKMICDYISPSEANMDKVILKAQKYIQKCSKRNIK